MLREFDRRNLGTGHLTYVVGDDDDDNDLVVIVSQYVVELRTVSTTS